MNISGKKAAADRRSIAGLLDRAKTLGNAIAEIQANKPSTTYPITVNRLQAAYSEWYEDALSEVPDPIQPLLEQQFLNRADQPRIQSFLSDPTGTHVDKNAAESEWNYRHETTFSEPFSTQIKILCLVARAQDLGTIETISLHRAPIISRELQQSLAVAAKDHYNIRTIDELFFAAGAEEDWWIEPRRKMTSERMERLVGWIDGLALYEPTDARKIVLKVANAILKNSSLLPETRHAVDDALSNESVDSGTGRVSSQTNDLAKSSLHPTVVKVAGTLFRDGHYRQAVFDACLALNEEVQNRSGRTDLDGTKLMQQVFSPNAPTLKFPGHPDEQQGFMWLYSGLVMAVRNPRGHQLSSGASLTAKETLELLGFVSFLFRALDRAT